ncbi:hypothetical protein SAMN05216436_1065 [bacterium A37T11]|nr:hypothetical protein SAMN05216436_1065 [bacterium A37T11]
MGLRITKEHTPVKTSITPKSQYTIIQIYKLNLLCELSAIEQ